MRVWAVNNWMNYGPVWANIAPWRCSVFPLEMMRRGGRSVMVGYWGGAEWLGQVFEFEQQTTGRVMDRFEPILFCDAAQLFCWRWRGGQTGERLGDRGGDDGPCGWVEGGLSSKQLDELRTGLSQYCSVTLLSFSAGDDEEVRQVGDCGRRIGNWGQGLRGESLRHYYILLCDIAKFLSWAQRGRNRGSQEGKSSSVKYRFTF